jgi:DNA-binding FrmR family transcriptional regulator
MAHAIHGKKKILTRIRRIKGQTDALEKALDQDVGAANGLMVEVLEGHIRAHLGTNDLTPEQRQIEVEQVVGILKSYLK